MRKTLKDISTMTVVNNALFLKNMDLCLWERFEPDLCQVWRNAAGKIHREDGPAVVARASHDPSFVGWVYYKDGQIHRENGPAAGLRRAMGDGYRIERQWWQNDQLHREHGPAMQRTDVTPNGTFPANEMWYLNGKSHRTNGPSSIFRCDDTHEIYQELWEVQGQLHRTNGPANVFYGDDNGEQASVEYHIAGRAMSREDYLKFFDDKSGLNFPSP